MSSPIFHGALPFKPDDEDKPIVLKFEVRLQASLRELKGILLRDGIISEADGIHEMLGADSSLDLNNVTDEFASVNKLLGVEDGEI